ncbi:MAG: hypothetical protein ACO3LE_08825, partial [Bdellovibrionota bacterium]
MNIFKNKFCLLILFSVSFFLNIGQAESGYPVYPPLSQHGFLVFEDSENEELIRSCQPSSEVCARFYTLPPAFRLATNPQTQVPMLTQGIFPGRDRLSHQVIYNLTLEPEVFHVENLRPKLESRLASKMRGDQIAISPLPVGEIQFFATGLAAAENHNAVEPSIDSDEVPVMDEEKIEKIVEKLSREVYFTKFYAPRWTGNLRSLGQRFSVSIQGASYQLEPAFQNMFLADGGNAFIGNISFRFKAVTRPIKMSLTCNLKTFHEVVSETAKNWNITRRRSKKSNIEIFSNEERNAIRRSLNIKDYCKVKSFLDSTVVADESVNLMKDLILNKLFDRAFEKVQTKEELKTKEGKDPKYTFYRSKNIDQVGVEFSLDIDSETVQEFSSDIDFTAGNISADQLDPNHWTLCSHWQRPNREKSCE